MRSYHRLLHLPHHKNGLSVLYFVATLRTFVISFLILFLPVVLYQNLLNMHMSATKAILVVSIIYLFLPISQLIFSFAAALCNGRWGLKWGFIIGQVFFLLFLLTSADSSTIYNYFWSFFLWGLASAFWWVSYHSYFIEHVQLKSLGRQIGLVEMLGIASGLIGPVSVGFLIVGFGKNILLPFGSIITLLSIAIVIFFDENKRQEVVYPSQIIHMIKNNYRDFFSYVGSGAEEMVYSVSWSLVLYFMFNNYSLVGIFSSFVIIISVIVVYLVAQYTDKMSKEKLEKLGAGIISSSWLIKALLQNPVSMFIVDSLYKIFFNCFLIPLRAIAYKHALRSNINQYVVFREIGYALGNITTLLVIVFISILKLPLWYTFIWAAFVALIPMIIREKQYV